MSLDGKLLSRARAVLANRRQMRETEFFRRQTEVYAKVPRIQTLDIDIRTSMLSAVSAALSESGDVQETVQRIGEDNLALQKERISALTAAGYPADYLDNPPFCNKCEDTGYVGTSPCSCLMELYRKQQAAELSSLLNIGDQCFENFQLKWYDEKRDPSSGVSPREHMKFVYAVCKRYAETFGDKSGNLLMTGSSGLGKTFLSACIAKTVFEKGFSVVYSTAGQVFSDYETAHFSRGEEADAAKNELRRYTRCDLLILDDLGTEMTTSFTVSSLYELINTRITCRKKTVVNTNLAVSEISGRYSPQIASRLEGEYQILPFHGSDIRILKKNTQ